jgi:hypothetical protein
MFIHPIYEVRSDSLTLKTGDSNPVDIEIRVSMDSAPGYFKTQVRLSDRTKGFSTDDKVEVFLGYDGRGLTKVFTGRVEQIQNTGQTTMVLSPLTRLYNKEIDLPFEDKTTTEITEMLAKEAEIEVDTGVVDKQDIKFPSYRVDIKKNLYDHIKELARLTGRSVHPTPEGKLAFIKYDAIALLHVIEYGKDILEIEIRGGDSSKTRAKVASPSAALKNGEDKHSWLSKEVDIKQNLGTVSNQILIRKMALKNEADLKMVAEAEEMEMNATTFAIVKIIGNEQIMLGDAVKIQNVPQDIQNSKVSLNGEFLVREIEHVFNRTEGFVTKLICRLESSKGKAGM